MNDRKRCKEYYTAMNNERMANYDLLRIISMIAVIVLHINAHYLTNTASFFYNIEYFVNIITRFSVPCFVMISGAFLLNNHKNQEYILFYKKSLHNIVLPFLGALLILFLLSLAKAIITGGSIVYLIESVLIGDFSNLWFMFMLCGLYFFTPFIIICKEHLSNRVFSIGSFVWLAFAVLFQSFSEYLISYSFGIVFAYMGYFLVGNVIFEHLRKGKLAWFFIFLSICLFIAAYYIRIQNSITRYSYSPYISFFSPFTAAASILLFLGFSNMSIKISFGGFTRQTFYIYLFHTAIFGMIFSIIKERIIVNEIVTIIIVSLSTLVLAWIAAIIYSHFWRIVYRK